MATIPGMQGDVFFGEVDAPLPDWRAGTQEASDDPTEQERADTIRQLGFDPASISRDDDGASPSAQEAARKEHVPFA